MKKLFIITISLATSSSISKETEAKESLFMLWNADDADCYDLE